MQASDASPDEATEIQSLPRAADAAAPFAAGTRFGAYVLRRLLGEGGMGCVYLAEQVRPVRREVALKLIREQIASPLARAYFEVERQALAQMQHPAIAQVFDAGTSEDGHLYLAMEVVEGVAITRFCRSERLGLDQRLALFARVCRGVQHAHQKSILHRDLKPANVLVRRVDGEPMPKIIDFGIAIGGDAVGDRAGTAVYMSPEQASQEQRPLDTRSDVYSLGVMLYEVLTDSDAAELTSAAHRSERAPHRTLLAALDSGAGDADAPAVAEAALRQATRRLPPELRAVLRKTLAHDRNDRYDSAAALADDVERFRERRPLQAMRRTGWYLLRTFAARHRLGFAAGTLAALALLVGSALAFDGLLRARRAAAVAQVEAAKATQVAGFVREMLAGIDPDRARSMDRSLMRLVLDSAAERAARELAAQPAVRAEIERTIAGSYASLGELDLAGRHYEAAIDSSRAAGLPAAQIARLVMRNAENVDNQGKAQEALQRGEEALALVAALPPDDRDRLYVESHLAGLECDAGKLEASRERYLRVLALQRERFGEDDEETLESVSGLAITASTMARFDEARPLYETLVAQRRARYGAEHSKTLSAINGLAVLELEQKHFAEAEKLLAPQLPIVERVFGADHPTTLRFVSNLGGAIRQQGRNEEARPYYERAFELSRRLSGPTSPSNVIAESNLANLLRDAGELDAALTHARAANENAAAAFGDNPVRAIFRKELATVLIRTQHYAQAERELAQAWATFSTSKEYGPLHPRTQEVVETGIELYDAWNRPDQLALWQARRAPSGSAAAGPG
jgi:non-specific serine/threonine protein kinase/serine/threonine-protein kinase